MKTDSFLSSLVKNIATPPGALERGFGGSIVLDVPNLHIGELVYRNPTEWPYEYFVSIYRVIQHEATININGEEVEILCPRIQYPVRSVQAKFLDDVRNFTSPAPIGNYLLYESQGSYKIVAKIDKEYYIYTTLLPPLCDYPGIGIKSYGRFESRNFYNTGVLGQFSFLVYGVSISFREILGDDVNYFATHKTENIFKYIENIFYSYNIYSLHYFPFKIKNDPLNLVNYLVLLARNDVILAAILSLRGRHVFDVLYKDTILEVVTHNANEFGTCLISFSRPDVPENINRNLDYNFIIPLELNSTGGYGDYTNPIKSFMSNNYNTQKLKDILLGRGLDISKPIFWTPDPIRMNPNTSLYESPLQKGSFIVANDYFGWVKYKGYVKYPYPTYGGCRFGISEKDLIYFIGNRTSINNPAYGISEYALVNTENIDSLGVLNKGYGHMDTGVNGIIYNGPREFSCEIKCCDQPTGGSGSNGGQNGNGQGGIPIFGLYAPALGGSLPYNLNLYLSAPQQDGNGNSLFYGDLHFYNLQNSWSGIISFVYRNKNIVMKFLLTRDVNLYWQYVPIPTYDYYVGINSVDSDCIYSTEFSLSPLMDVFNDPSFPYNGWTVMICKPYM